jgi:hypothetical protein
MQHRHPVEELLCCVGKLFATVFGAVRRCNALHAHVYVPSMMLIGVAAVPCSAVRTRL